MIVETIIKTCKCDYCQDEIFPKSPKIRREMILQKPKGILDLGDWLDFCNMDCADKFLQEHDGIRWVYDNEVECPKEGEFCLECSQFDKIEKICQNKRRFVV